MASHSAPAGESIPKGPVFGWSSFKLYDAPGIPSVEDQPHVAFTTSGRAAIYQALLQLHMPQGSTVLVPSYHCPTMVAPVLMAGHRPAYFAIRADGLPDVQSLDAMVGREALAIIVSHYFGLAQSLHEVRAWCDTHGVALIEDCAHCYFGQAGERPIGSWGDYCVASLSKFFPVPEAGLLGSSQRAIKPMRLIRQGLTRQIKGWADVLETAAKYKRLAGMNLALASIFDLKRGVRDAVTPQSLQSSDSAAAMMEACDMARVNKQPLAASMFLRRVLPRGRIIAQRQRNFAIYADVFSNLLGARALVALPKKPNAPYVFPLWVDDGDRVYHALRIQGIPVFRWDNIWPGTPSLPHDAGPGWNRHVLQLLCHQDLFENDILQSAMRLKALLKSDTAEANHNASINKSQPCLL